MSATLTIAALLTLKDQFSAPLRAATAATDGIRRSLDGVRSVSARAAQALSTVAGAASRLGTAAAQAAAVGQIATGFGLESYVRDSLDLEHRLAALGNTANMSSQELATLHERLRLAASATNQFQADLLTANETLIAAGMEWKTALDITPVLGRVATATQATMGDLAQTAFALQSNLRVPVERMEQALERLTVAGQSGQFELKDMAREFSKIGASMGALKFTGLENVSRLGAALQIARRGAGDASEAANNLQNFLAKLAAPDVQNNFKKFGIDLPRLLKTARERGLDPFLVTLAAVRRATGGDEFKLGELFGDMQVQNFIKPMLLYTEDYKQMVREIDAANGVIQGNFDRMMNTTVERWKQFRIQLATEPMPWVDGLIDKLSALLRIMNQYPQATSAIATGLVAIAGAAIALKAAAMAIGAIAGGVRIAGALGRWLGKGGRGGTATALGTIASMAGVQKVWVVNMPGGGFPMGGLPDVGGKTRGAGGAARSIGARLRSLIAGVAMQASLAWQAIAAFGARLAPVGAWVLRLLSPMAKLTAAFAAGYAIGTMLNRAIDAILSKLMGTPTTLGSAIYDAVQAVRSLFAVLWQELASLPGRMLRLGGALIDGLLAGLRAGWDRLKAGAAAVVTGLTDTVKSVLGIRSPSRVFADLGGHLMGGLALGIDRAAGLPRAALGAVAASLAAPLAAGPLLMAAPAAATMAPSASPMPMAAAAVATTAAPIQITVNLNGPATPEAANDIAAAVRREVERALAEAGRREQLARRAALIDGGMA